MTDAPDMDETAHDLVMRSVSLLSSLLMESPRFSTELNDKFFTLRDDMRQWLVNQADAALASSPATTGEIGEALAELSKKIASTQSSVEPEFADALYSNRAEQYRTFSASPHPVAPSGEIAGLVNELNRQAATPLDSLSYAGLGHTARKAAAALTASEAEAADLRRKLEEARKALEPFATVGEIFEESAGWSDTDEIELSPEDGPRMAVVKLSHFRRASQALESDNG